MLEKKTEEISAPPTDSLLACGILAGPLYIVVTAVQALTRDGFDPRIHRYNLLTIGDLGWVHRTNYIVAGALMLLFAVGVRRVLRHATVGVWASRLFGLYGVAYICSGLFPADPVVGFPPGSLTHVTTWHGVLQMASRSMSSLALVGASVMLGRWFARHGLRRWEWFCWGVPLSLAGFAVVAAAGTRTPTRNLAFLVPGVFMWVWISAVAGHLCRRAERRDPGRGLVIGELQLDR